MILALERFPSKMVKISLDIQRGRHRHQENGLLQSCVFLIILSKWDFLFPRLWNCTGRLMKLILLSILQSVCFHVLMCFPAPSQGVMWVLVVLFKSWNRFPNSAETSNFLSASLVLWSQTGSCLSPGSDKNHPGQLEGIIKPWFLYLISPHTPHWWQEALA